MRNRKRSYNSKPFLVVGGPHDGQTINVLASPITPVENVVRLPVLPKVTALVHEDPEIIEYYAHQVCKAHYHKDKPWEEPYVESYWFYCIDQELEGQGKYDIWDQDAIERLLVRLRTHRKETELRYAKASINLQRENLSLLAGIHKLLHRRQGEPQYLSVSPSNKALIDNAKENPRLNFWIRVMPVYFFDTLVVEEDESLDDETIVAGFTLDYVYVDYVYEDHETFIEDFQDAVHGVPSYHNKVESVVFGRESWNKFIANPIIRYDMVLKNDGGTVELYGVRTRRAGDMPPNTFTVTYSKPFNPQQVTEIQP